MTDAGVAVVADDVREGDAIEPVDLARWQELATRALEDAGARGELTLTFVDADDMAALNAEHMGKDGPTDVLSFPLDALSPDRSAVLGEGVPVLLGDVVVCPHVAAAQAVDHAGSYDDELALLVVHGVLHVVGYDHADPDDAEQMQARERELLETHHWRGPAPDGFRQSHD